MHLELLPNEVLLELFDYIDGTDLLSAFYELNSRFKFLLRDQYRSYRFNSNCVPKRNFDIKFQQHLSFITDRIIALSLINHTESPEQINLFFSYTSSLTQYNQLRSLSLFNLRSYHILMKIIDQCHYLCNLTHLTLQCYFVQNDQVDFQLIANEIWSLPKLTHCDFHINDEGQQFFCMPTIISSSLKSLSIYGRKVRLNHMNRLFEQTIYLRRLLICVDFCTNENCPPSLFPTLVDLNINILFTSDIFHILGMSKMISLFQNTPNLIRLNVDLANNLIDGNQWEVIIRNFLPKLKMFILNMHGTFSSGTNMQDRVDDLIHSFRSSFWIDEHQWFVRCLAKNTTVYIHTLYTTSNYFEYNLPDLWRSTYPHDDEQEFYNKMTKIHNESFFDQSIPSDIRLTNIEDLRIKFPINDQFWSVVPSLNRLNSLTIFSHADIFQPQLQVLLDRAPCLSTLIICQDTPLPFQTSLLKYTNASIRQLNLRYYDHGLNEEECIKLSRSPLGTQCQVLCICTSNLESIIYLVKNMINLQKLDVLYKVAKNSKPLALTTNDVESTLNSDERIQWLKEHLPSTCFIIRHPYIAIHFQILINHK